MAKKLTINLSDSAEKRLEALKKELSMDNTQIFRRAMQILEALVEDKKKGALFIVRQRQPNGSMKETPVTV